MPPIIGPQELRQLQQMGGAGVTVAELTRALAAQLGAQWLVGETTVEWPGSSHFAVGPTVTPRPGSNIATVQLTITKPSSGDASVAVDSLSGDGFRAYAIQPFGEPAKGTPATVFWAVTF